jgi:hypothetical protein
MSKKIRVMIADCNADFRTMLIERLCSEKDIIRGSENWTGLWEAESCADPSP